MAMDLAPFVHLCRVIHPVNFIHTLLVASNEHVVISKLKIITELQNLICFIKNILVVKYYFV